MLFMISSSSLLSGISVANIKFFGELVQSESVSENFLLIVILLVAALVVAFAQMHMLANAMKYYDQIEVQPIY